jgi:hypothetical protein
MSFEVLTCVGGFSLFHEFEQNSADEAFNDSHPKDVLWHEELADCVITHIGNSTLFLEQIMDIHHELKWGIDKPTRLGLGRGGFQVVFLMVLSECNLYPLLLKEMQYGSNIASFSLSWDPGGYLLRLIFHASGADLEINHGTDNSVGLDERQDVGVWLVLGKFPPWRLSCFRLEKHEHQHDWVSSNNGKSVQQLYGIIRMCDPGISQAKTIFVHPEIFLAAGDRLVLDMILPWDSSAFSPGNEEIFKQ